MTKTLGDLFPPGEFIRDEIEARNWTQEDLAEILGRPLRTVNQIITGKKAITPQTAKELAAAFGTSAELWLNLENAYRLGREHHEQSSVSRKARLFELVPVKDMIKRRWIRDTRDPDELESEVKRFLEISSLDERPALVHAARKATSYHNTTPAQLAWYFRAKQLAKTLQAAAFDANKVSKAFPEIHALTVSENLVHKVPSVLADIGIRFVVVEPLPRSRIDGATLWLDGRSPVIAVSMRYDRIDGFWHTLAHELSHVRHGDFKDELRVDVDLVGNKRSDVAEKPPEEQRADKEASNFLVPSDTLDSFMVRHKQKFSKSKIVQFANLHQIHPGIVVGQLQFRQAIPYSHSREMLVPVRDRLTETALTDGWGHLTSF
jgi:HTH-type transcriptional regulator / antitoxin HigA